MNFQYVKVERHGHVTMVALNRPDKLNALSVDLMEEIVRVCELLGKDEQTRVVVFTGAGKHFSAGVDLTDATRMQRDKEALVMKRRHMRIGHRVVRAIYELDQITIGALHGAVVGGGAVIAAALDFRIGSDDCYVYLAEINLGMNLNWWGLPLFVHLIGPARAKRLAILGNKETAQTMREWGFLDEVVPRAQLAQKAMELAHAYAEKPPVPTQMIKRSVNAIASALDQSIMHMDFDQFLLSAGSQDAAEAARAFFEKRKAEFKGN